MNREFDSDSLSCSPSPQVPLEIELAVEQLRHIPTPSSVHQVPLDLQIAVDQLRFIPIPDNVEVQNSSPVEPQNPFQTLENTFQRLNQNNEDAFHNIESILQNLNQTNISALSSSNEPQNEQNESQPQSQPQPHQGGEGLEQRHTPAEEQEEEGFRGGRETETASYDRFNTLVMRHTFTVPRPGNVPDIAAFYRNVIGVIRE